LEPIFSAADDAGEQRAAREQAKAAQEQMRSLNRKGGFCATPNCSN
jgi:hypothetical protein